MSKEKKLIPDLRFPEFDTGDNYAKYLFTETFLFATGKNIKQSEASPEFQIPCVRYGELYHMYHEVIYEIINKTNLDRSELHFSKGNEILLPSAGEDPLDIGSASALTLPNIAIGRTINILRPLKDNLYLPIYVSYYINQILRRKISTLAKGSSISNVYNSDLKKLELFLPSLEEQQKVASCLSSLDELITAYNEKLETLKDHKKGLMQNLFPDPATGSGGKKVPNYRFPEFVNDGKWVEKVLSQVADYENGKAHEQDIVSEGKYIAVNSKFISTDGETVKYCNTPFCLAESGDILMVLSDVPNGRAIAKCYYVNEDDKYTVNQRICKITPFDCNNLFLYYIMNRNPYFLSFDDRVKQTNLRNDDVQNFPFLLPEKPEEQQKIASCLSALDELITAEAEQIEQLQLHKKGLMQGIFPKIEN